MLFLKKLSECDGKDVYNMLQDIEADINGFSNEVKDMPYEEYLKWLERQVEISNGINLPEWMVPQTTFWLYSDSTPVGIGRIRHYLNDALKENGGHIGYAISSAHRGSGYGNEILRLLLIECKMMGIGIDGVQLRVDPYKQNESSNRIILNNGGKLTRQTEEKNFYVIEI